MQEHQIDKPVQWAVVHLFGHDKIAGRLSTEALGGDSFVRVDVPQIDDIPAFTKLLGKGAIYGIDYVSEQLAVGVATRLRKAPIDVYDLPPEYQDAIRSVRESKALPAPAESATAIVDDDEDDLDESRYEEPDY